MPYKQHRKSVTLTGKDVDIYERALEMYGNHISGPNLVGKALAEKMGRVDHRNNMIRIQLVALADVAVEVDADPDTMYAITWMSSVVQKMITGRWSASKVRELITRMERIMKEEIVDQREQEIKGILEG
jgi:hypothetical protein